MRREKWTALLLAFLLLVSAGCSSSGLKEQDRDSGETADTSDETGGQDHSLAAG